jgi:regulation of enolase protein 1 (concanavalin A-like superfamily)
MPTAFRLLICVAALVLGTKIESPGDKPHFIPGWGKVIDPDGDCSVKASNGKVTISVPDTLHNLSPVIGSNSPRVLKDVEGDFTATVKVTGDFIPGEKATKPSGYPFVGAGLLIWQDEKNCIRLERNSWWMADQKTHACYTPLVEYFKDGVDQGTNPGSTTNEFFKGPSTFLRLERKADKVNAYYSHDGKDWILAKQITVDLPAKLQVGVAAVNSSDKPLAVEFEQFKIETPR